MKKNVILVDADGCLLDWEFAFNIWMSQHGFTEIDGSKLYYDMSARYGISRDQVVKLIKIFKKMGVSSSNQYVDAMRAKWEPIYKQAEEEYWADIKKRKDAEDAERNKSDWTTANLA